MMEEIVFLCLVCIVLRFFLFIFLLFDFCFVFFLFLVWMMFCDKCIICEEDRFLGDSGDVFFDSFVIVMVYNLWEIF